ncbi:MAG: alpha/beta hydrolase [Promethearchaeota archaeon]
MPIMNKSKIRPDVLKIMEAFLKIRPQIIDAFYKKEGTKKFDFQSLWQKVMEGNERCFKGEDVRGYLSEEEQLFLAKFHRFATESGANYLQKKFPIPKSVKLQPIASGGVPAEWQTVPSAIEEQVLLYFHGGGFIMGSVNDHRLFTVTLAYATNMRVLSVDYRLAPEYPYPASLEDSITVYKWLLSMNVKPENIIIGGDSAGGNLTLSTLVKLRDDRLPLPAGAFCLSPVIELGQSSESFFKNSETDPFLADIGLFWWHEAYSKGADPQNPLISPLYADLKGLPPILVQVSTTEIFYDHSTRFVERAKAAGVDATLQTWDDMMHVFQAFGLPESREAINKISKFVKKLFN